MKKALSIIIALLLVATMGMTVFATETPATYTITIKNENEGHTYEAYQIFKGDLNDGVLSNIQWGSSVDAAAATAALGDAATKAAALKTTADAEAFALAIAPYLTTPAATTNTKTADDTYVLSGTGVTAGYYLIKDANNSLDGDNDSYTSYILKVVANTEATPKSSVPTVEKKVDDEDDTDTAEDGKAWQDSADYDIGDTVPFQLTATLANNVTSYESYTIIFHDTMCAGLTFEQIDSVKVGTVTLNAGDYTAVPVVNGDGTTTLTITISDVRDFVTDSTINSAVVVVEYSAELNDKAVIGSVGNPNVVYLEYSNNPNQKDADITAENPLDTGDTAPDKVIVFTYQTVINKVDQDEEPLTGAAFTLQKKVNGVWTDVETITGTDSSTFTFKGLDAGTYKIIESVTPAGYNTADDIEFVITATHEVEAADPKLTALSATSGTATFTSGLIDAVDQANDQVSVTIKNNAGTTLPSTGGIGTTIFYVVGGLLMIAAIVVLVAKKRVSAED